MQFFKRIRQQTTSNDSESDSHRVWNSAGWTLLLGALVPSFIVAVETYPLRTQLTPMLTILLCIVLFALVVGAALVFIIWLLKRVPPLFGLLLVTSTLLLLLSFLGSISQFAPTTALVALGSVLIGLILLGSGLGSLRALQHSHQQSGQQNRWQRASGLLRLIVGAVALIGVIILLLVPGGSAATPSNALARSSNVEPLALASPSQVGEYTVQTLTYGSGSDLHRPEFADEADILTEAVDGSAFIEWNGLSARDRTAYWGFDTTNLPRNGRVWHPNWAAQANQSNGQHPLVLIVHGNASMREHSHRGYDYLGELLASRGYIVVSVDQNFLNRSLSDLLTGLGSANDLRGWLLLEHLMLWRKWNSEPSSPFFERVDLDNIALVGHSVGGEAVAIATAYNKLKHNPDDATISFDFGFGIRGVVAIAPVNNVYQPASVPATLSEIDYLVLHGSHDADLTTFAGKGQYARTQIAHQLDDEAYHFKSAVYIWGANHGQFNTEWGRTDQPQPSVRLLNTNQLIAGEEQRQIARVFISVFLDVSLKGDRSYLPLLRNPQRGTEWLPDTVTISRFADSAIRYAATYEEDIAPSTASLGGVEIFGRNLSTWHEQEVEFTSETGDNRAVYLGWDSGDDLPSYTFTLPDDFQLEQADTLTFAFADTGQTANSEPIEVMVEVRDQSGEIAGVPVFIQPQLKAAMGKLEGTLFDIEGQGEPVLQTYTISFSGFTAQNPSFDSKSLSSVRFEFDANQPATLVFDELGLAEWE